MAGNVRHFVDRSGRYHARLVVPKDLRSIVGKTELGLPLGGDYMQALKHLPGAVAQLQHQIALAEQEATQGQHKAPYARYPLAPDQIAYSHYMQRLNIDDKMRNDTRWGAIGINDLYVNRLREGVAGLLDDEGLIELIGEQLERFRALGNIDAEQGSDEWRIIARALCNAELEALERVAERDEGDFTGKPTTPLIVNAQPPEEPQQQVKFSKLWADYVAGRIQAGFMRDGGRRQDPVIKNLRAFLKHDDARRITKKDLLAWRDHLMTTLVAKTVSDVYLSTIRSLFTWAVENDILPENVAATVKQPKPRKVYNRERGYTEAEAIKVLTDSRSYMPNADQNGYVRETPQLVAAKRWVPIICAFTGARVSEITQLRGSDIRQEGENWIIRITPDAGTVKAGGYRDVPLHLQIVNEGFIEFVRASGQGPLFHNANDPAKFEMKAKRIANQLANWLSSNEITPKSVQPNHAWRHRLKTQCLELGISDRVMDAIQGHAGRTAGDNYGDVTLKTKIDAVSRLPTYKLK